MRRTKAEAEQTRHDILKAALILFDEQGYVQTSLSDIARKAEVTRGAIYWHFDNKEQIVAALAQAQFDDLMRQNAAAISAPDIWQTLATTSSPTFTNSSAAPTASASTAPSNSTARRHRWKNCTRNTSRYGRHNAAMP